MKIKNLFLSIISIILIVICSECIAQNNPLLIGVWGFKKGDNAVFEIKSDSIFYVDELYSIKYSATNDSLFFYFNNNYKYNTKYLVTPDSLILYKNNKAENRYLRFTE